MADKVYPCPLCGRSVNRKGTPFTDPSQTMSHINGAHDARHSNESGGDHADEIRENAEELDEVVSQLDDTDEETAVDPEMVEAMAAQLEEIEMRLTAVEEKVARIPTVEQVDELYGAIEKIANRSDELPSVESFDHRGEDETMDSPIYDPTEEFKE